MADFEAQVKQSREQVGAAQAQILQITQRIDAARGTLDEGPTIDVETATTDGVHAHAATMTRISPN